MIALSTCAGVASKQLSQAVVAATHITVECHKLRAQARESRIVMMVVASPEDAYWENYGLVGMAGPIARVAAAKRRVCSRC